MAPARKKSKKSFDDVKQQLEELKPNALIDIIEDIYNNGDQDKIMTSINEGIKRNPTQYTIKFEFDAEITEFHEDNFVDCDDPEGSEQIQTEALDNFIEEMSTCTEDRFTDIKKANTAARKRLRETIKELKKEKDSTGLFYLNRNGAVDCDTDVNTENAKFDENGCLILNVSLDNFAFDDYNGEIENEVDFNITVSVVKV